MTARARMAATVTAARVVERAGMVATGLPTDGRDAGALGFPVWAPEVRHQDDRASSYKCVLDLTSIISSETEPAHHYLLHILSSEGLQRYAVFNLVRSRQ